MKRRNRKPQPAAEPARESWRRVIAEWATVVVVYLFVSTCVVQGYVIPTPSMENTLLIGDHLWVDKLAYAPGGDFLGKLLPYQDVKHGDIVVFRYPLNIEEAYVKRVIGLPGDRIRIENKQLIRNGSPVDEPYKVHKTAYAMAVRDHFPAPVPGPVQGGASLRPEAINMLRDHVRDGELVVPPGRYFVMGDNRDLSDDSRFWGFVPRENIIGKPWVIYWSYDAPTDRLLNFRLDHFVDVALHFFDKTRWERSFQVVKPL